METRKILVILGIVATDVAFIIGLRFTGIPGPIDYLPQVGIGLVVVICIALVVGLLANVSQNKLRKAGLEKAGEFAKAEDSIKLRRKFRKGYLSRMRNKANAAFDSYLAKIEAITKWNLPEGYLPKSLEDNRILTFALMDYALRLDIFLAKFFVLSKKIQPKLSELNNALGEFNKTPKADLRIEIRNLRSGSLEEDSRGVRPYGWAQFDAELLNSINRVSVLMFEALRARNTSAIQDELIKIRDNLREKGRLAVISYNQFSKRASIFGLHHEINAYILNMYDIYDIGADFKHHYIAALPGARFRKNSDIFYPLDSYEAAAGTEVDIFGFDVESSNEGIGSRKLLNPRKMSQFLPPLQMAKYLQVEWYAMLENFRSGILAANTRRIPDYAEAFKPQSKKDVHLDDDAVVFTNSGGTAFDRRALANPGNLPFRGKKHFAVSNSEGFVPDTKYPMLTVTGMQDYLRMLIEARERESKTVIDEFLARFPDDAGGWPDSEEDLVNVVRFAKNSEEKRQNG